MAVYDGVFACRKAAFACVKAACENVAFALNALSLAKGIPPAVDPSWTTTVFFVVSMVISATAPVNALVCVVLPRLN